MSAALPHKLLLVSVLLATKAAAQAPNDECVTALPIVEGVTLGSTLDATDSPITGDCASFGGFTGSDVWFTWTSPDQGLVKASLVTDGGFATFDTVLSAFADDCGSLQQLACNDDAVQAAFTLQSQIVFVSQPGQPILFELGGWNGAAGEFGLSLVFTPMSAPTNDECATAVAIGDGVTEGSNFLATQSAQAPACGLGGVMADADVWYRHVATATGLFTASVLAPLGSADFDTIMAVHGGTCDALELLACNDDGAFSLGSQVETFVSEGQELWISIGGYDGAQGTFSLSVSTLAGSPPPNDDCETALPVTAGPLVGTTAFAADGGLTGSCALFEGTIGRDVWYSWTAQEEGLLTATTTLSGGGAADFDTVIAIFGGDCGSAVELGCNDDAEDLASLVSVPVEAGGTYLIELGGWNGDTGSYVLNVSFAPDEPSADVVLDVQKISTTQGGFEGDLGGASASYGIAVAALGDLDGDGVGDLAVGSPFEGLGTPDAGAVWILFLESDGTVASHQRIATGQSGLTVATGHTEFGVALAALGDLGGDGTTELAVGAPGHDDGGQDRGAVWILSLAADGSVLHEVKISDLSGGFGGLLLNGDAIGTSLAALGDVDGDGLTELAVGSPANDDGFDDAGATWIFFLNTDGTVHDWQRISAQKGNFAGPLSELDLFGSGVAGPGDLDLDGRPDLVVGAIGDDDGGTDHGALWVLNLMADGKVKSEHKISSMSGSFGGLVFDGSLVGKGLAAAGDLDGDGVGDLYAGASGDPDGGPLHGAVWILFLRNDGSVEGFAKISAEKGGFPGPLGDGAFFGEALAPLGDHDGDGRADLAVGNRFDDDGATDLGAVWMLFLDAANPWINLGEPLAGTAGMPTLLGKGPLTADTKAILHLMSARRLSPAVLVLGLETVDAPFLGGVLVPAVDVLVTGLLTGSDGSLDVAGRWPGGVPASSEFNFQFWIQDPVGPEGWAASNALRALTH
jgi:FG-GAP repeat